MNGQVGRRRRMDESCLRSGGRGGGGGGRAADQPGARGGANIFLLLLLVLLLRTVALTPTHWAKDKRAAATAHIALPTTTTTAGHSSRRRRCQNERNSPSFAPSSDHSIRSNDRFRAPAATRGLRWPGVVWCPPRPTRRLCCCCLAPHSEGCAGCGGHAISPAAGLVFSRRAGSPKKQIFGTILQCSILSFVILGETGSIFAPCTTCGRVRRGGGGAV